MIRILHQYCSGNQIENIEMGGACSTYGGRRGLYSVLVRKHEGKRPLGRPRRRRGDNIKTERQEVGCEDMDWINAVQDRDRWRALVNAVMNFGFYIMRGFIDWLRTG